MTRRSQRASAFLVGVSLALLAPACANDDASTGARASHVAGRVEAEAASGVTVETFALDARGTLSALDATATTDAQGRYELDVTLPDGAVALVLRSAGTEVRAAIVSAAALEVAGDANVTAPPLDATSTVAADVAMRARVAGDVATSLEQQALFLAPALRAQVAAAAAYEAAVTTTADATGAAAAAWTGGLAASIDTAAGGDAAVVAGAAIDASLALSAALDLATDDAAAAAAYAAYVRATVDAHLDAGYGAARVGVAASAAAEAMARGLATIEDVGTAHLAVVSALAVSATVDAQVAAIAGVDGDAVARAGVALRAAVEAAVGGAFVDTRAIGEAFAAYQAAVTTALSARLDVDVARMVELTAEIDAAASALQAALADAGTDAAAIVAAHAAYHAEVASQAHVAVLAGIGTDDAAARATLHVMAQLEAATR